MSRVASRQRRVRWWQVAAACASWGVWLTPAVAQGGPVAKVEVEKEAIRWHPAVEYRMLTLVVSGNGIDLSRDFEAPEAPYLKVEAKESGRLPDGTYSYELRVTPAVSPEHRKRLAAAREAMDRGKRVDPKELGLPNRVPPQSGHFSVREGAFVTPGEAEPGPRIQQTGDLQVEGSLKVAGTKSFVAGDPRDTSRLLVYAALEGPEAGTYHRGTARTVGGEAVIELPGHFGRLTEAAGLTVQLTPAGGWSRLYVAEKTPQRLVVRSADGRDVAFDYLVQGVRRGYADFEVERSVETGAPDGDSEER